MSKNNLEYDRELCPDGICTKFIKKHKRAGRIRSDGQGVCGGKIIRIYTRYGPLVNFGEFTTWEELACCRCNWKKKVKILFKTYVRPKNEIWVKYDKKKKKKNWNKEKHRRLNERRKKEIHEKTVDGIQKKQHDDIRTDGKPLG